MKNMKKIVLIFLVIVVIGITFYSQFISLIEDIENTAKSKEAQINRHIDLSKGFIDLLTLYGNDFFKNGEISDSELYSLLQYDASKDSYHLDAISGTKYEKNCGSLTGSGSIPAGGILRDELNLALRFNQHFDSIYSKLPDVAWLYYTSEKDFINIYPFTASKDFAFSEALQKEKFYTYVTPQNNPLRESLWTPVYLDHAGKGLMVSLSSPIYDDNTFMGVVSLDLTNDLLSEMVSSKYEIYIVDETDSVIANSLNIKSDKDVLKFDTLLNDSQSEIDEIDSIDDYTVEKVGQHYIYSLHFANAPWKMIFRVSIWSVIGKAALYTLPIMTICLLLLFTFLEVEKRKKTDVLLTSSLEDLTSYQKLLENAAKYDFLTSTVNRRGLMDIFNKFMSPESKIKVPAAFIMGDIDLFKQFNDTFGHAAGDKVLIEIAKLMQQSINSDEVVCRWGGEEFLILLLNKTGAEALLIAEKIRADIEAMIIPWENTAELKATMTFGVAEYDYNDSFESNISKADSALYIGKEKGRNQVVAYGDAAYY